MCCRGLHQAGVLAAGLSWHVFWIRIFGSAEFSATGPSSGAHRRLRDEQPGGQVCPPLLSAQLCVGVVEHAGFMLTVYAHAYRKVRSQLGFKVRARR